VIGVLLDAGLLEDVVLGSGPQGQVAAGLGIGAGSTQFAGASVPFGEADTGDRGATVALGVPPLNTGVAAGADGLALVPVDGKVGVVEEAAGHLFPVGDLSDRSDEVDAVIAAGVVDLLGIDVSRVHQVLVRHQIASGQGGVDVLQDGIVVDRCRGGVDVGDQVRGVGLAGLAEVDLVAGPAQIPLGPGPRLGLVRRA
jgi:hypothetical protein